jgi:hypothetical protein
MSPLHSYTARIGRAKMIAQLAQEVEPLPHIECMGPNTIISLTPSQSKL